MTATKKAVTAAMAEGKETVVFVATTVVMALADNSGNDGAYNGSGNRGSGGATTINQNAAGVEAKMVVVVAAVNVAGTVAMDVASVKLQRQIVVAATMVIAQFTLGGTVPRGAPNWQQTATFWLFFGI